MKRRHAMRVVHGIVFGAIFVVGCAGGGGEGPPPPGGMSSDERQAMLDKAHDMLGNKQLMGENVEGDGKEDGGASATTTSTPAPSSGNTPTMEEEESSDSTSDVEEPDSTSEDVAPATTEEEDEGTTAEPAPASSVTEESPSSDVAPATTTEEVAPDTGEAPAESDLVATTSAGHRLLKCDDALQQQCMDMGFVSPENDFYGSISGCCQLLTALSGECSDALPEEGLGTPDLPSPANIRYSFCVFGHESELLLNEYPGVDVCIVVKDAVGKANRLQTHTEYECPSNG